MKLIHRAYKFQIYPTEEQKVLLGKSFGCARFVYNYFLNSRSEQYTKTKTSDNYYGNAKRLTQLKNNPDTIWLTEVNVQMLQSSLRNLDTSYVNFFKKRTKYPKFKSKRKSKDSITFNQKTRVQDSRIFMHRFKEGIKVNIHREIKGEIGKFTVSKNATCKYFVSILTEQEHIPSIKTNKSIGIDLGIKHLCITSDGIKYKNNRYTKKYQGKLKVHQQYLSRKKNGSNRYEKQSARIHSKISNLRNDNLHKISNEIVKKYDVICLEDLDISGMLKNRNLSKYISDASWGRFTQYIDYKARCNDKTVIKVDRFYPSSKTCNVCSYKNQELTLLTRNWTCPICLFEHDRDRNASINILKEGLRVRGQELPITRVEDKSVSSNSGAYPKKPESQHVTVATQREVHNPTKY
jgi:putative transposase